MKALPKILTVTITLLSIAAPISAQDADKKPEKSPFSVKYEDKIYTFPTQEKLDAFKAARADSLYQKIGGKAAVGAAIDLFYKKLLADEKISPFFDDVNMKRQHKKQKAFIAAALGGPEPWEGKDMRKAHANLEITEEDFNIVAKHLQATLEELKLEKEHIAAIMKIVGSTKDAVLNRKAKPAPKK